MQVRHADDADAVRFWRWWTDRETRRFNSTFEPLTWEAHLAWFCENLRNPHWYVGEVESVPVGAIRFDPFDDEGGYHVSIVVDPWQRGKGYGPQLIRAATERMESLRIRARIHRLNRDSISAFTKAGYQLHHEDGVWRYFAPITEAGRAGTYAIRR